ncbi:MAG: hypothetical protein QGH20_04200, partial [Candidatus Latescibacteria bacterium]|nr:hypothetical protein [Candidatus Latescibacterota bacterium]
IRTMGLTTDMRWHWSTALLWLLLFGLESEAGNVYLDETMRVNLGIETAPVSEITPVQPVRTWVKIVKRAGTEGSVGQGWIHTSFSTLVAQGLPVRKVGGQTSLGRVVSIGRPYSTRPDHRPLKVRFDRSTTFTAGQTVSIEVVAPSDGDGVAVPLSAAIYTGGKWLVFAVNGEEFAPVEIEVGGVWDGYVNVLDGLYLSDIVVTSGVRQLWTAASSPDQGARLLD